MKFMFNHVLRILNYSLLFILLICRNSYSYSSVIGYKEGHLSDTDLSIEVGRSHEAISRADGITKAYPYHLFNAKYLNSSQDETLNASENNICDPIFRIVFLKTHKAASTTTAAIFERYGYYRNLTFAFRGGEKVFSARVPFTRALVAKYPGLTNNTFHMLTNHARYNRKEMELVIPNATYITILRKPEDQLESAFGYFEMYRGMKIAEKPNPFKTFIENAASFYKNKSYAHWELSRNGMLYDLGLDHRNDEDESIIRDKILEIDRDFHLVMIQEYYDESLILMRKLLCWEFEDILYLSRGVRSASHRFKVDIELKEQVRQWTRGDVLLYNHFNRTFWKKVQDYGPSFGSDLQYFRELNQGVYEECVMENKFDKTDKRVDKLTLKTNSEKCKTLMLGDVTFTKILTKSMATRFGKPKLGQ